MTKEETTAMLEKELRNPQTDFTDEVNLAVQTGYKTIPQQIEDFERAGRAIMVANADEVYPEMPGLPAYPDPIEAKLLMTEINADLLIARKRVQEDQNQAAKAAADRHKKNEEELAKFRAQKTAEKPAENDAT
nr:MAG: hypothetical protein [Microviridae sp.]